MQSSGVAKKKRRIIIIREEEGRGDEEERKRRGRCRRGEEEERKRREERGKERRKQKKKPGSPLSPPSVPMEYALRMRITSKAESWSTSPMVNKIFTVSTSVAEPVACE